MKIRLTINGKPAIGSLLDTAASNDLLSMLPLSFKLDDYASTEKIADLPRRLSIQDAPAGTAASAGDIAYYAPWGNLAIFYKNSGYATGLVKLGSIDSGAELLNVRGSLDVTVDLA